MYDINTLKQELRTAKTYEHNVLDKRSFVDRHRCHISTKLGVFVDEDHSKLPTLNWLPILHERFMCHVLLINIAHVLLLSCL